MKCTQIPRITFTVHKTLDTIKSNAYTDSADIQVYKHTTQKQTSVYSRTEVGEDSIKFGAKE